MPTWIYNNIINKRKPTSKLKRLHIHFKKRLNPTFHIIVQLVAAQKLKRHHRYKQLIYLIKSTSASGESHYSHVSHKTHVPVHVNKLATVKLTHAYVNM